MNIVFFDVEGWEKKPLSENFKGHKLSFFPQKLNKHSADKAKSADIVSVFVSSHVDKETLALLPKLKMIATRSTGYDHIDVEECKKRKIVVANVPTYGDNTVAEHTFALLLSLSRKIPQTINKIKLGHFDREGIQGFDLKDKTIGVIGTGSIGRHVCRIANGFEMNVLAFDLHPDPDLKKMGVKYLPFDSILKQADVLTFHVPLNPHTLHLLNMSNIKKVKKGCILLNTARGGIIETEAILYGLKSKILSGACLDVLENESFIEEESVLLSQSYLEAHQKDVKLLLEEHVLTEQDNVFITPHNAFNSKEAVMRILQTTMENIMMFVKKRSINRVA